MHFYLYQITNKINGKIYIGVHQTDNLDDGYMCSGSYLQNAINKYGIENFEKQILEYFDDAIGMYNKEREIVNQEFLLREDVYNLRIGGQGGFDYVNKLLTDEDRSIIAKKGNSALNKKLLDKDFNREFGRKITEGRQKLSDQEKERISKIQSDNAKQYMQTHGSRMNTPEAIANKKEKFAAIGHAQGEKNSQFGTCWIWHEIYGNKKIDKTLLNVYLTDGWIKTRKIGYVPKV